MIFPTLFLSCFHDILTMIMTIVSAIFLSISASLSVYVKYSWVISRKKKQNFAGFSGANSRDFRGKKVKIRGTIGRFQAIFAGEKSKFAEKSAHFAGF